MSAPDRHARFLTELQAADDEELNPGWAPRIAQTEADRICLVIEKWCFVIILTLAAAMFWSCAYATWWCSLLAVGSFVFAGCVACYYSGERA